MTGQPAYTDADVQAARNAWHRESLDSNVTEVVRAVLDAVAPAIAARAKAEALREAGTVYESYVRDAWWRDDSLFHANGRFHGEQAAEWMQKRADEIEAGR